MILLTAYSHPRQLRWGVHSPYLGRLVSPHRAGSIQHINGSYQWASDNDCYTGLNEIEYRRLLARLPGLKPLFLTLPDVLYDGPKTLQEAVRWLPELEARGIPPALVLQDGIRSKDVPWDSISAVFIGGTTAFKVGAMARKITDKAKARGKWVHMGRVNAAERFQLAYDWGCDSVDGSSFARFGWRFLPRAIDWLKTLHGGGRILC